MLLSSTRTLPVGLLCAAAVLAGAVALLVLTQPADGQAVIGSGNLHLGVQKTGQLMQPGGPQSTNCANTVTSVYYDPTGDEGMDCDFEGEGWGVTVAGQNVAAYKNTAGYTNNCVGVSAFPPTDVTFTSDATTAESVVVINNLIMTQKYEPFPGVPDVYQDHITMKNDSPSFTLTNVLYRRVMSWGSAGVNDDSTLETIDTIPSGSFGPSPIVATRIASASTCPVPTYGFVSLGSGPNSGSNIPLIDQGPADSAMVWDFNFGTLAPKASRTFTLYYGAAPTRPAAMADLAAIGALIFNVDRSHLCAAACAANLDVTFFMAFGGDLAGKPPVASFEYQADQSCMDPVVHFTSTASDPDGDIVSWDWDFGDGNGGTGPAVTHPYAVTGWYDVTLTVKDSAKGVSTMTKTIQAFADTDCPPTIVNERDRLGHVDHTMEICFTAADADTPVLSWQVEGAPEGGQFDWETHCWIWLVKQTGTWTMTVTVRDAHNFAATRFNIVVPEASHMDDSLDSDRDGIEDIADNCPSVPNHEQVDRDRDSLGDACDAQPDEPDVPTSTAAAAARPIHDDDADWVDDAVDNCPGIANRDQTDMDRDHQGDACDLDLDGDGVPQAGDVGIFLDDCPLKPNPDQKDANGDGVGDACAATAARPACDPCAGTPVAQLQGAHGLQFTMASLAMMAGAAALVAVLVALAVRQRRGSA
ncbi:MAG: PKD domain-containing protein [bacterium]